MSEGLTNQGLDEPLAAIRTEHEALLSEHRRKLEDIALREFENLASKLRAGAGAEIERTCEVIERDLKPLRSPPRPKLGLRPALGSRRDGTGLRGRVAAGRGLAQAGAFVRGGLMNHDYLHHEVAALMGPLACGTSARAGQRSRQSRSASPSASVMPCCCSRPPRCTRRGGAFPPGKCSPVPPGGVSGTLPTLSQEETLS